MNDRRTISDIGESGCLDLLRESLQRYGSELVVSIGDDAAVRTPTPGMDEILTSDAMVEGTHFKKEWLNWKGLARRSVLAAASDIAAMGGVPKGFLLSVGLPPETSLKDLEDFVDSLSQLCQETGLIPYGGDTAKSQKILVDVTVVGEVAPENLLRQSGAQPGDSLWVSGTLGASRAVWMAHENRLGGEENPRDRFWSPPIRWTCLPDLREGLKIRAATDLSDGLAVDLKKILRFGSIGAKVELEKLPVDPDGRAYCEKENLDPHEFAFSGGEDFELLLIEEGNSKPDDSFTADGVPVTKIGVITSSSGEIERTLDGKPIKSPLAGYEHFSKLGG